LQKKCSKRKGVENVTEFSVQNFDKTNYPDNFFDAVYAIESACHSTPKEKFLKEAYRILKPKGKLLIFDGYTTRKPKNKKEKEIVSKFTKAFALKELITHKEMEREIKRVGFTNIKSVDKTKQILPSVNYFYNSARVILPIIKLASFLPIPYLKAAYQNTLACKLSGEGIKLDLACYFIHYGEKPN
jgi:SAM-dependent methyltransferase